MRNTTRDIFGALAVAIVAVALFVLFMGSMVMLGQTAGQSVKARIAEVGAAAVLDSTAAGADTPSDTFATTSGDTSVSAGEFVRAGGADSSAAAAPLFGKRIGGPYDGVPVLCYHYLRGSTDPVRVLRVFLYVVLSLPVLDDDEIWTLSEGGFEKQMRYLHENGYRTVSLDDLTAWQYGHKALPRKSVVITFDDGDRSVYDYAYPILQRYGFQATYFVITAHVGREWEGLSFLSWDELREMETSGVFDIESHTHDLHYKVEDERDHRPVFLAASRGRYAFDGYNRWEDAVRYDLERSRAAIALGVGRPSRHLAWPYGHTDPTLDHIATSAGFERTCLLREGLNASFVPVKGDTLPPADRVSIRRFAVSARTSLRAFKMMLSGEYTSASGY